MGPCKYRVTKTKTKIRKSSHSLQQGVPSALPFSLCCLSHCWLYPPSSLPGARVKGFWYLSSASQGRRTLQRTGHHGERGSSQRARLWAVGLQEPVGCSLCSSLPPCGSVSKPCPVLHIFLTTGQSFLTCLPATSLPPYNGHTCQSNDLEKEITRCHLSVKRLPMACHQTWNKNPISPPSDSNTLSFVCLFV